MGGSDDNIKKRGCFIVLEGCDRSGKTTQCKLITEKLNSENIPTHRLHYPKRSTCIGAIVDAYLTKRLPLRDEQIHLLFAINRRETIVEIEEYLNNGTSLIVDRYSYSGIAYSSVKKGIDVAFCRATELGLPKPDATIFLDSSIADRKSRNAFGDEIYENEDTQSKVYQFYKDYFFPDMKVVNVEGTIDEVNNELMPIIQQLIHQDRQNIEKFNYHNLKINKTEKFEELEKMMDNIVSNIKENLKDDDQMSSRDFILNQIDEVITRYQS